VSVRPVLRYVTVSKSLMWTAPEDTVTDGSGSGPGSGASPALAGSVVTLSSGSERSVVSTAGGRKVAGEKHRLMS